MPASLVFGYGSSSSAYTRYLITAASRRRLLAFAFSSQLKGPLGVTARTGFHQLPLSVAPS